MSSTAQVGGDHYKAAVQHWDLMVKYDIEYLLGNASKYLVRWKKKGGIEDLKKALSYLDRWLEEKGRRVVCFVPLPELEEWMNSIDLGPTEQDVIERIHCYGHIPEAAELLRDFIYDNTPADDHEWDAAAPKNTN